MPDFHHSIQIDAPADRVFALVSTAAGLTKWWAVAVTEDASAKSVELGFFKRATVYRLKPVSIAAPREADWLCESGKEWANARINFKLTENAGYGSRHFSIDFASNSVVYRNADCGNCLECSSKTGIVARAGSENRLNSGPPVRVCA